ncbi:MAG: DUF2911 domain-containing protein [Bacteroidota bacterium]
MKNHRALSAIFVLCMLFLMQLNISFAQQRGADSSQSARNAEAVGNIGSVKVRVTYGAPEVKGRTVFGGLEKWDRVWRAGANEATTVTFSQDVSINGDFLKAGTYSFFVVPKENEDWRVIFNSVPNQWGSYDYDQAEDALRTLVSPEENEHQERLVYSFENITEHSGELVLRWATTKLPIEISTKSVAELNKEIVFSKLDLLRPNSVLVESQSELFIAKLRALDIPALLPSEGANLERAIVVDHEYYFSIRLEEASLQIAGMKLDWNDSNSVKDVTFDAEYFDFGVSLNFLQLGSSIELTLVCDSHNDLRCKNSEYIYSLRDGLSFYFEMDNSIRQIPSKLVLNK